ncbi:MAG: outer membrane beta-barrel protein, partial [Bacteroidota bacterium]
MQKITQLFFLLLTTCHLSFAQSKISGIISNQQNEGIFYATVALFNQADSALVKGSATDEAGKFILDKIEDGTYYLEASMLGFATARINQLKFPDDHNKMLNLTLSEDATVLSTVEVTAKVPLLEQKADRLVVNVADNITSLNGSLLDVMKRVPGVLVIGDKLSMAGQRNVTILLNGKSTQYMNVQSLLKDLPGDNIQKVEVIHQPGAEFDAEGTGPIINIILKKNSLFGTNGSLNVGLAQGEDFKHKSTLALSHHQGSFNVSGSVGWKHNPYYDEMRITRLVGADVYKQVSIDPYTNRALNGGLSMDWDMTKRHRIGFSGRYFNWSSDNVITNTTEIDFADEEALDLRLITKNSQDDAWQLRTFNPYYRFEIDTTGHKIDFDVNWVSINTDGSNTLVSDELNFGVRFPSQQYLQTGETTIITSQLDYVYPLSKKVKLSVGAKFSEADLDNNLQAADENPEGIWINNLSQSNHFLFDEQIKATYAKVGFATSKWQGTVGLRYENSSSKGYSITLDSTLTRNISQLFPSASLSKTLTDEIGATLAYSYRIDRPNYSNLNPFVY